MAFTFSIQCAMFMFCNSNKTFLEARMFSFRVLGTGSGDVRTQKKERRTQSSTAAAIIAVICIVSLLHLVIK